MFKLLISAVIALLCLQAGQAQPLPDSLALQKRVAYYQSELYDWYRGTFDTIPQQPMVASDSVPWHFPKASHPPVDLADHLYLLGKSLELETETGYYGSPYYAPNITVSFFFPDTLPLHLDLLEWHLEAYQLQDQKGRKIHLNSSVHGGMISFTRIHPLIREEGGKEEPALSNQYTGTFWITDTFAIALPIAGSLRFSLSYATAYDTLVFSAAEVGTTKSFQQGSITLLGMQQHVVGYSIQPPSSADSSSLEYTQFIGRQHQQLAAYTPTKFFQTPVQSIVYAKNKATTSFDNRLHRVGLSPQQQWLTFPSDTTIYVSDYAYGMPRSMFELLLAAPHLSEEAFAIQTKNFLYHSLANNGAVELDAFLRVFKFPVEQVLFYAPAPSPQYSFNLKVK